MSLSLLSQELLLSIAQNFISINLLNKVLENNEKDRFHHSHIPINLFKTNINSSLTLLTFILDLTPCLDHSLISILNVSLVYNT